MEENALLQHYEVKTLLVDDDETDAGCFELNECVANSLALRAVITFNSKVHRLAQSVSTCKRSDIRMIGYDLLEKNVDYLRQGVVNFLIAQCPERQAYLVLRDLCRYVILKQPVQRVNYMPIDILMKENIDYYHTFES
jgi:LacI family transcriptional regulator